MTIEKAILQELKAFEEKENAKVLLAVEAGSRAYGLASKDSDYDVRFVYVRNKEFYLRLNEGRTITELVHTDELDMVGWDLKKFLKLLKKSNPSVFEFLQSEIVYYEHPDFYKVRNVAHQYFNPLALGWHYLSMSNNHDRRHIKNRTPTKKIYLHAIRGTLSAIYVIQQNNPALIKFDDLRYLLPCDLLPIVDGLVVDKLCGVAGECDNILELDKWLKETNSKIKHHLENDITLLEGRKDWDELNQLFVSFLGE